MTMLASVRSIVLMVMLLASTRSAQAEDSPPTQPGLLGAGVHLQIGLEVGETLAGEPVRIQAHPRASLRYDQSATRVWRLVGRHQRLAEDGGHAELTISPALLRRWRLSDSLLALAGGGLSAGAFTRFLERGSDAGERNSEFAIPIAAEASGSLIWQWKSTLSIEFSADYRPVFFSDGTVEHLLTQGMSASIDF